MKAALIRAAFVLAALFPVLGLAACAEEEPEQEARTLTADDIPVPIASAQVGDWARYVNADGHTLSLTVVERWNEHGDDYLVIQSSLKKGRKKRPVLSEERVAVNDRIADARDLGRDDYLGESVVLVGGRRLDCVVVHYHDERGDLQRQSYFSDQVPVYGLVRGVLIEGNKRTTALRLEDFGFADGNGTE